MSRLLPSSMPGPEDILGTSVTLLSHRIHTCAVGMSGFRSHVPSSQEVSVHRQHAEAMSKAARELKGEKDINQSLRWDLDRLKSEEKRGRDREERLVLQVVQLRQTIRDLEEELNVATEVGRKARDTVKKDERDFQQIGDYIKQEQADLKRAFDGKKQAESQRDIAMRRAERAEEELEALRHRRARERKELEETIRHQLSRGQQSSQSSAAKEAALLQQLEVLLQEQESMRRELNVAKDSQRVSYDAPAYADTSTHLAQHLQADGKPIPRGGLFAELFRGMFPWGEDGLMLKKGAPKRTDVSRSLEDKNMAIVANGSDFADTNNAIHARWTQQGQRRPLQSVLEELADGRQLGNDPENLEKLFWQVMTEAREAQQANQELTLEIKDLREALHSEASRGQKRTNEADEARKALSLRVEAVEALRLQLDEKDTTIHALERELSFSRSHIQAVADGREEDFRKSLGIRSQAAASLELHRASLASLSHERATADAARRVRHDSLLRWR